MKLNIGCGKRIKKGYTNVDIRKTHPDVIVGDIRKLPFPENSVEEIFANDVYEHVPFAESFELLKHWVSILKPGGSLVIQTPNTVGLAKMLLNAETPDQIQAAIRKTFGGQDYKFNFHYTAGHPILMEHFLREAGIKGKIDITSKGTNMKVTAIK